MRNARPRARAHRCTAFPFVIKDNIDTADLPTTGGSVMLEGWCRRTMRSW
jgi:Asp-tRNA(Asn)/Glu-tRNA(Gln) amidotransferase A subunit family amidase